MTERIVSTSLAPGEMDADALREFLKARLQSQLEDQLDGRGHIVTLHFSESQGDGLLYLTLRAECLERLDQKDGAPGNGPSEEKTAWTEPLRWTE